MSFGGQEGSLEKSGKGQAKDPLLVVLAYHCCSGSSEPGAGSIVFNSLVPFFIGVFFLVSLLCGKGAAFQKETS